jgi:Fur family transcriptional regulator, ferric uptake regulator
MSNAQDVFRKYLSTKGLKYTRQRRAIAEAFLGSTAHPSLIEILELSRELHPSVGYATVYRTMKLMAECGLATEHRFSQGDHIRYEPYVDGEHHDHLICLNCGLIIEFEEEEIEELQARVADDLGFTVRWHRHEIYGYCGLPQCQERAKVE